jgi:DnaJ-class molecular chaperone
MDYYSILQVEPDATLSDIKKSYKKLAIKYHPDKNKDSDSHTKFVDINTAYQVLSDEKRRYEYDRLSMYQREQLYDFLKESVSGFNVFSDNQELFKSIVEHYYGNEDDLREDVNNFNFRNIYNKFHAKLQSHFEDDIFISNLDNLNNLSNTDIDSDIDIPIYDRNIVSINYINLDIYGLIYTTLADRYVNKYKKITVYRKSDNTVETLIVPLVQSDIVVPYKGERIVDTDGQEKCGDLIIKIICEEHSEYRQINDTDIVLTKYISLYQYLYGGEILVTLPDDTLLNINFDSFIERTSILCMPNHGLPFFNMNDYDDDDIDGNDNKNDNRGNLYIHFKINNIDADFMKQEIERISC